MAQSAPRLLAHLGPLQQLRAEKLPLRLPLLFIGLIGFGASCALLIKAGLGALGWDVFTLGLMEITGMSYGALTIITSFVVLLFWLPLKEMPGLGTLANAILVGLSADIAMGGHLGVGALLIAFTVGALIGWFLPYVTVPLTPRPRPLNGRKVPVKSEKPT